MGSERMKKKVIGEAGALGLQKGLNSMYSSIIQKKTGVGRQSNIQSSNLADTRREFGRPSDDVSDGTFLVSALIDILDCPPSDSTTTTL
jgi:hypothetical protein